MLVASSPAKEACCLSQTLAFGPTQSVSILVRFSSVIAAGQKSLPFPKLQLLDFAASFRTFSAHVFGLVELLTPSRI